MRRAKPKVVKSLVRSSLGPLEEQVLHVVCALGRSTVRDVLNNLRGNYAYTTVMTTVDRLFQKGLLRREAGSKAYVYRPLLNVRQLETQVARDMMTAFLTNWQDSPDLLASVLVDAVGAHDPELLECLAEEIRIRQVLRLRRTVAHSRFQDFQAEPNLWPLGNS